MKLFVLSLLSWLLFATPTHTFKKSLPELAEATHLIATCKGANPCKACSNCKYCKLCNSGGKCGVCTKSTVVGWAVVSPIAARTSSSSASSTVMGTSQCTAKTQKGLRCKRMVRGGGKCWQHK